MAGFRSSRYLVPTNPFREIEIEGARSFVADDVGGANEGTVEVVERIGFRDCDLDDPTALLGSDGSVRPGAALLLSTSTTMKTERPFICRRQL
jgi:hypothetical protein